MYEHWFLEYEDKASLKNKKDISQTELVSISDIIIIVLCMNLLESEVNYNPLQTRM